MYHGGFGSLVMVVRVLLTVVDSGGSSGWIAVAVIAVLVVNILVAIVSFFA